MIQFPLTFITRFYVYLMKFKKKKNSKKVYLYLQTVSQIEIYSNKKVNFKMKF